MSGDVDSSGAGNGQFNTPTAVALQSNGNIVVLDAGNFQIQILSSSGTFISQFGYTQLHVAGTAKVLALDANDNIFAVNTAGTTFKFDKTGTLVTSFTTTGAIDPFSKPGGLFVDKAGALWVASVDTNHPFIKKYTSAGVFQSQWGVYGSGAGQINHPQGIAVRR